MPTAQAAPEMGMHVSTRSADTADSVLFDRALRRWFEARFDPAPDPGNL